MDQELSGLQDEVKILKNEIKGTLVGIRDYLLTNVANPFPTDEHHPVLVAAPTQPTEVPSPSPIIIVGGDGSGTSAPTPPASTTPHHDDAGTGPEEEHADSAPSPREETPIVESVHQARPAGRRPEAETDDASPDNLYEYAPSPQSEPDRSAPARTPHGEEHRDVPDLLIVATLASWIEDGASRIGRERLQSLVDIYSTMSGVSSQLHEILTKLITLDGTPNPADPVTLRACMRVLVDLDSLLQRSRVDHTSAALLFTLMGRGGRVGESNRKTTGNNNGNSGLASLLAL